MKMTVIGTDLVELGRNSLANTRSRLEGGESCCLCTDSEAWGSCSRKQAAQELIALSAWITPAFQEPSALPCEERGLNEGGSHKSSTRRPKIHPSAHRDHRPVQHAMLNFAFTPGFPLSVPSIPSQ